MFDPKVFKVSWFWKEEGGIKKSQLTRQLRCGNCHLLMKDANTLLI